MDGSLTGDACFASGWVENLTASILNIIDNIGLSGVETDGPYPGFTCSSRAHSHHKDFADSVYWQTEMQSKFYNML